MPPQLKETEEQVLPAGGILVPERSVCLRYPGREPGSFVFGYALTHRFPHHASDPKHSDLAGCVRAVGRRPAMHESAWLASWQGRRWHRPSKLGSPATGLGRRTFERGSPVDVRSTPHLVRAPLAMLDSPPGAIHSHVA